MRLAEAAGLSKEDIITDECGSLVFRVRHHPWRRLKTKGSERVVPLEGQARWAAQRILTQGSSSGLAFPRYNKTNTTNANANANAASAALNKWMKEYAPDGCTMHGFRHSRVGRLGNGRGPTRRLLWQSAGQI